MAIHSELAEPLVPEKETYVNLGAIQDKDCANESQPHRKLSLATILAGLALVVGVVALVVAVVGYDRSNDHSASPSPAASPEALAYPNAPVADPKDLVETPGGMHPRQCLHTIPNGTQIVEHDKGVTLIFTDGTRKNLDPCPVNPPPRPDLPDPTFGGHQWPINWAYTQLDGFQSFDAQYTVPNSPEEQSGQTVYIWTGSQYLSEYVIQPVLGWNSGGWNISPWNCCPAGHKFQGGSIVVYPGDTIQATMTNMGSSGYEIVAGVDGQSVSLMANNAIPPDSYQYTVETYSVMNCEQMPSGGNWIHSGTMNPAPSEMTNGNDSFLQDCNSADGAASSLLPGNSGIDMQIND
jgi:hypothetical protein